MVKCAHSPRNLKTNNPQPKENNSLYQNKDREKKQILTAKKLGHVCHLLLKRDFNFLSKHFILI